MGYKPESLWHVGYVSPAIEKGVYRLASKNISLDIASHLIEVNEMSVNIEMSITACNYCLWSDYEQHLMGLIHDLLCTQWKLLSHFLQEIIWKHFICFSSLESGSFIFFSVLVFGQILLVIGSTFDKKRSIVTINIIIVIVVLTLINN